MEAQSRGDQSLVLDLACEPRRLRPERFRLDPDLFRRLREALEQFRRSMLDQHHSPQSLMSRLLQAQGKAAASRPGAWRIRSCQTLSIHLQRQPETEALALAKQARILLQKGIKTNRLHPTPGAISERDLSVSRSVRALRNQGAGRAAGDLLSGSDPIPMMAADGRMAWVMPSGETLVLTRAMRQAFAEVARRRRGRPVGRVPHEPLLALEDLPRLFPNHVSNRPARPAGTSESNDWIEVDDH